MTLTRSWLPTAFGASLLAWEIPVLVAIVARMADGPSAMAALGVALSVLVVVNSPALALAPVVVAELGSRGSRALFGLAVGTGAVGSAVITGLAVQPPVSTTLPALIGLPPDMHDAFRTCLLSFATAPLAVALRRYLHGRFITGDNTGPIATAAMVRIVVTVGTGLLLLRADPPAAAVGGIALSCGAWADTAYLAYTTRRLRHVPRSGAAASRMLTQHARMTSSVLLNMSPALVTTMVIARSGEATASLIVWPAVYGLTSLGTLPLSDLDSVGAAYRRRGGRDSVLLRFVLLLAGGLLAGFLLVILTPLASLYVRDLISVPSGPAHLGIRWMPVLVLAPPLWALRGWLRALAIAEGNTRALPRAAAVHFAALLILGSSLPLSPLPGIACASLAVVGALTTEIIGLARFTLTDPVTPHGRSAQRAQRRMRTGLTLT